MLTRWNDFGFDDLERSFAALDDLRQEMSRVLQRFDVDWPGELQSWSSGSTPGMSWPQVQISDEGEALRLVAEVPGFDSADLSITLEQNTLTIRGERAHEVPEGYSVHRKERGTLRFARAFALPVRVESDKVEAKLSNGLLELRMPKVQAERPRTIQVRAA